MLRVLAVASEIFPLVKTGGLADVTGALPAALNACGAQVLTVVPGYPAVLERLQQPEAVHHFPDLFGGPATVLRGRAAGLDLLVVLAPHLFGRSGNPYLGPDGRDWPDNALRYAGLGAAAAAIASGIVPGLSFDIVHAHDWQAAMAIVYLHFHRGRRPATVLTIHNLAFQGRYHAGLFPRLGLPPAAFSIDGLEYQGDVSFLKGALVFADWITTVSPTYAREITFIDNGMGLDGVLRARIHRLSGILNGIDETVWNPATDPSLPARFDAGTLEHDRLESTRRGGGKSKREPRSKSKAETMIRSTLPNHGLTQRAPNRAALRRQMGLEPASERLLLGIVSRLTSQKGLDMLLDNIGVILEAGAQLVLLGSGEAWLEHGFRQAAQAHPGQIGCVVGYDEALSHLIQAGSDAILVPSRFEPCGLTQLYALRYGALPVVSRVGGLADSVIDANQAALMAGVATGIQFWPATSVALEDALHRLISLWHDQATWQRMQQNGMRADVSWRGPARSYMTLFQDLLAERH